MPFDFAFEAANRILRCQFSGDLNDKTILDYYNAAKIHARNLNPKAGLLEFKDIVSVDISTSSIAYLAETAPETRAAAKMRVIVAPTDLIYGKCRAFEILGEGNRPNLHIVRTLKEAFSLLGLEDPAFTPIP